jgi:thiol-disulfide isomerase/thioredoxin
MLSGCGHCKKAKPEFTKAAEHFKDDPKVEFAAVDCTSYQSVCAANEVTGYPTIKYFSYLNKNVKAYNSGRTVSLICSSVHHVTRLRFRRRIS